MRSSCSWLSHSIDSTVWVALSRHAFLIQPYVDVILDAMLAEDHWEQVGQVGQVGHVDQVDQVDQVGRP